MRWAWRRWTGRIVAVVGLLILSFVSAQAAVPARAAPGPQIAITVDDLPVHGLLPRGESRIEVARQMIGALRRAHLPPVYGFVNGQRIQDHPDTIAVLAAWRQAGDLLGNHTWSHMNLDDVSVTQFEGDLLKNEPVLRLQMDGQDWHWLRFPYLAEGGTPEKKMALRVFLAQHGYKIAGVTMNFDDYEWNDPYARCSEKGDTAAIAYLERSYLLAADEGIRYSRDMSKTLYGHDIPYVLLMHIGAFDAHMMPRLLDLYRRRGFTFITLDQAEKDPFYKYDLDPKLVPGPDTLKEAMEQRHLPVPPQPRPPAELEKLCR